MSSPKILESKKAIVAEIVEKMKAAKSFVFVDYKGLNVEQATNLRKLTREANVDYKIYKNTFLRFAAKECGYEGMDKLLVESTAVAFCNDDEVAPAKIIADFAKANNLDILEFKGGVISSEVCDKETIAKISKLANRESLIAQILGSLNAPISNLAYVISAIRDQKETA